MEIVQEIKTNYLLVKALDVLFYAFDGIFGTFCRPCVLRCYLIPVIVGWRIERHMPTFMP